MHQLSRHDDNCHGIATSNLSKMPDDKYQECMNLFARPHVQITHKDMYMTCTFLMSPHVMTRNELVVEMKRNLKVLIVGMHACNLCFRVPLRKSCLHLPIFSERSRKGEMKSEKEEEKMVFWCMCEDALIY